MSAHPQARGAQPRVPAEGAPAAAASTIHDVRIVDGVFYPSSDGKPLAENMWQAEAIMNAASDLKVVRPQALVAVDILVYPEEGNTKNSIAPDVLVAFERPLHKRSSYFVWREGKPPDWVLEVASPSTQKKDRECKLSGYAAMGVAECWLFDPKGDAYPRGTPRLQGLRLEGGEYVPLDSRIEGGLRLIRSEALCLDIRIDSELLRFRDPATGRDVQHRAEETAQRRAAEARAETEAKRREAAEARVAALEAALRRSPGGEPG